VIRRPDARTTSLRIGFGSCNKQSLDMTLLWPDVAREEYDAFAWIGDAVYADERVKLANGERTRRYLGEKAHEEAYERVKRDEAYAAVRRRADVVGTWDDHDYGFNNAGKHWSRKAFAKKAFLDFLDEPVGSERRTREGGVWDSVDYVDEASGRRARVILLDLRWDLEEPDEVSEGKMMSETQWAWFETQLAAEPKPEVTIVGSGIQVIEAPHLMLRPLAPYVEPARLVAEGLESWSRVPREQSRLFDTIKRTGARVVFMSGDVHHGQIAAAAPGCYLPYKTIDITSSGFTHTPFRDAKPWPLALFLRLATPKYFRQWILPSYTRWTDINYGEIEIDWARGAVFARIKSVGGKVALEESVTFAELDKNVPDLGFDRAGCNLTLEMSPKMRAFRIVVFFTWLAGVYAFKLLAPIFVAAYAVRRARRYARARGLKQD